MSQKSNLSKKQVIDELWYRGVLSFKLDAAQKKLYDLYYNSSHKVMTWLMSRRSGKTFTLCVLALEQCLRKPNSIVKFASPTKIQVNNNVRPLFAKLLEDCPDDIKPNFSGKDYIYYFPNGSEIQLAGTDSGHAEKLRGGDSDVWFVDEAGSCDDLEYTVKSILLPTTLITKGKGILASTPPRDPEHQFIGFIERAEQNKSLMKMTIDDNPRLTHEQKEELYAELGGKDTEDARRELFCEIIRDPSLSVIPEFTEAVQNDVVKEWPRPPYFDCYEAMDIGFQDLTVVLFAYYDFRADKVIIEDELVMNGPEMKLNVLTDKIKEKEKALWTDPLSLELKKPYFRVSDINYIVQNEIRHHSHNEINFIAAKKDDKESAVNNLRMMIASKKIIINPKCVTLIRHLKNAKFATVGNKTKLGRGSDGSHFDALDAAIYLIRHIVYTKNPYPIGYGLDLRDAYGSIAGKTPESVGMTQMDVYRKMFNIKPRKYNV
jgi:hypothetical protein